MGSLANKCSASGVPARSVESIRAWPPTQPGDYRLLVTKKNCRESVKSFLLHWCSCVLGLIRAQVDCLGDRRDILGCPMASQTKSTSSRRITVRRLIVLLILALTVPAVAQNTIAIRAGSVVDPAKGSVAKNQIILVENGKIKEIGANVRIPDGAGPIDRANEWPTARVDGRACAPYSYRSYGRKRAI